MAVNTLDVLSCKITIGDADPGNPMAILNPVVLTEVQEIEIVETYKKLIGTAKVIFPRERYARARLLSMPPWKGKMLHVSPPK